MSETTHVGYGVPGRPVYYATICQVCRKEIHTAITEGPKMICDECAKVLKEIVLERCAYKELKNRPRGRWHYPDGKSATIGQSFGVICDQCGTESEYCTNFCGECGADMREKKNE